MYAQYIKYKYTTKINKIRNTVFQEANGAGRVH